MKTIGLIGGMSWESTSVYYEIINEVVKEELGGLHSAKIILYSLDFAEIEKFQTEGNWHKCATMLTTIAMKLEKAGADFIVLCSNTMHKIEPTLSSLITIPILHITALTAEVIKAENIRKVGLLGTKYTMQENFYKQKLIDEDIEVLIPTEEDMATINDIIYNELCVGTFDANSRKKYIEVIEKLKEQGAEAIVLACTEIGLLVTQKDSPLPLLNTTHIHAVKAALMSVANEEIPLI